MRVGVLLSDHKVAFVFAGVVAIQGFGRRDDEGPLQLKPLILSVVRGLQLLGVQQCSAPRTGESVLYSPPHHPDTHTYTHLLYLLTPPHNTALYTLYAVWWISTVL